MSDFVTLFNQYKNQAEIAEDREVCALLSKVLERYKPEQQLTLLKNAIDNNLSINEFALRLGVRADATDLKNYLDAKARASAPAEIPAEVTPARKTDLMAWLPKATPKAPEEDAPQVPPSGPRILAPSAPSDIKNRPQPKVEEETADDGSGDDGEDGNEDESKTSASNTPLQLKRPPRPGMVGPNVNVQPVEPPSFGDWFKHPIESFQKTLKNREMKASESKNSNSGGLRTGLNHNSKSKQGRPIFGFVGLVFVFLILMFAVVYTATKLGDSGVAPEFPQGNPPSGLSPDSDPETVLEGFEMNTVIDSTEPLLKKPTIQSFVDGTVWSDFPISWAIWFLVLFAPLLMLVQDRFAEHEETDLRMVVPGIIILLGMVFGSYPLSALLQFQGVDQASLEVFKKFFEKFLVIVGVLVNIAFQWSATMSGKKDYSALAFAGLFLSGAIVYWWYPDNTVVAVIGWALMLGGIVLQYIEIGVSGQGTRAVIVSLIMIAAFFFGFSIGVGIITDWSVALYDISPVMALILYQWRVFIAVIVISTPIAIGIGFLAGMFLLRIERSDGGATEDSVASIARLGEVVLYDAISFGVMLMYPLVSVMWFMSAVSVALN